MNKSAEACLQLINPAGGEQYQGKNRLISIYFISLRTKSSLPVYHFKNNVYIYLLYL